MTLLSSITITIREELLREYILVLILNIFFTLEAYLSDFFTWGYSQTTFTAMGVHETLLNRCYKPYKVKLSTMGKGGQIRAKICKRT